MAAGCNLHDAIVLSDDEDLPAAFPIRRRIPLLDPPPRRRTNDFLTTVNHARASTGAGNTTPSTPTKRQTFFEEALKRNEGEGRASNNPPPPLFLGSNVAKDRPALVLSTSSAMLGSPNAHHSPPSAKAEPCPYYLDEYLGLTLYCGPGFEEYHPVLGTMDGHQEYCDEWEARQLQRRTGQPQSMSELLRRRKAGETTGFSDSDPHNLGIVKDVRPGALTLRVKEESQCLNSVLTIFPNIEHEFVRKLFRKSDIGPGQISPTEPRSAHGGSPDVSMICETIVSQIVEMDSYPKQPQRKRKRSVDGPQDIKWNKNLFKNATYFKEALMLLADAFTKIPTHFIQGTLRSKGNLCDTYQALAEHEENYNMNKAYPRMKKPRQALEKKYQRTASETRVDAQYTNVVNEFQAARQLYSREDARKKRQKAEEELEETNRVLHEETSSMVECQCCFSMAPINRVVHCESEQAHFFCNACIVRQANDQIGAMKSDMSCFDMSECKAEIAAEMLLSALPVRTSDKLGEIRQLEEIQAAGLEGLEQCPFCEFQAICPPVEDNSVFECQNLSCEKSSCRKCREKSHLPKTCEEAKKENGLSARHAVEEARSQAMMRQCPGCDVKIIKSSGCNKMTCTNCRQVMCYVCKKDISGTKYEHFDKGPGTCRIYDDPQRGDRHQVEADEAEDAAIAAARERDGDLKVDDLQVEAHLNRERANRPGAQPQPAAAPFHMLQILGEPPAVQPLLGMEGVGAGLGPGLPHLEAYAGAIEGQVRVMQAMRAMRAAVQPRYGVPGYIPPHPGYRGYPALPALPAAPIIQGQQAPPEPPALPPAAQPMRRYRRPPLYLPNPPQMFFNEGLAPMIMPPAGGHFNIAPPAGHQAGQMAAAGPPGHGVLLGAGLEAQVGWLENGLGHVGGQHNQNPAQ